MTIPKLAFNLLFALLTLTIFNACNTTPQVALELTQPTNNLTVATDNILVSGTISNATDLNYTLNGGTEQTLEVSEAIFAFNITLSEGANTLVVTGSNGATQQSITRNITYTKPPEVELRIIQPANDITVSNNSLTVEGIARQTDKLSYRLNAAAPVIVNIAREAYSFTVNLRAGENTIEITAENAGGSAKLTRKITLRDSKKAYNASTTEASPSFIRPETGTGLTDVQRTVKYHLFSYIALSNSYHEILSEQNFDGYLHLYETEFDPSEPTKNLIAQNDDSASFSETTGGTSRIRTFLTEGKTYIIVTSACGSIDAKCGSSTGNFSNRVTENVPAPPPDFKLPTPDNSRYNITLRFAEDEITQSLTPAQKAVFAEAVSFWEEIITEDIENYSNGKIIYHADYVISDTGAVSGIFDDILIDIKFSDLGGPGDLLGQAAPRITRNEGPDAPLTVWGMMEFDISEFEPSGFFENTQAYKEVLIHEMAHVLGIGTLWTDTNLVDDNYDSNPPRVPGGLANPNYNPGFTGPKTVLEYNKLLTSIGEAGNAKVVPIANSGGPGNYNGHWRELVFGNELMTPFAEGLEDLSLMTVASLDDLGYTVNTKASVIASDYKLPPPPIAGQLKQTKPNNITYNELSDFAAAKDSIKAEVTALVQSVDLKLNDIPNSSSGCDVADYAGFTTGSIAFVRRGGCLFSEKIDLAVANGASAILIMNQGDAADRRAVFGIGGLTSETKIPVMSISYDLGVTLSSVSGLELYVNTGVKTSRSTLSTQSPSTQALNPGFEIISGPIGTMLPDGTITLNKKN